MTTLPQQAAEYFGVQDKPRKSVMIYPDNCVLVLRAGDRVALLTYDRHDRQARTWLPLTDIQARKLAATLKEVSG